MRIGLLAPDFSGRHGWSRYAIDLISALLDVGASLTVVSPRDGGQHPHIESIPLLPDPADRGLLPRQFSIAPKLTRALAGCEVIHSLIELYAPAAAIAAGPHPLFVTGHGSYVRPRGMRRFPVSLVYQAAYRDATLLCVSRYTEAAARAAVPGVRTRVIANGVDAARFAAIPRRPDNPPTVLFVGAVKARKGLLDLVGAMSIVRTWFPDARCLIVGSLDLEPRYVDQVRAAIAAAGLEQAVTLAGRVDDAALHDAYGRASVFAMPSRNIGWTFEGFGLALLEASAAGLPVIGSRECGAEDAVVHGVTGLLAQQADGARGLADALIALLRNPDHAARMGQAGRAHAAAHTWARAAGGVLSAYTDGLKSRA